MIVAAIAGLAVVATAGARAVRQRADGASILLVIEDGVPGPPRADSIVLATWHRRCDTLALTFIPRDLVVTPGGEQLAILIETVGARGMAEAIAELVDSRIVATLTTDLSGVEQISAAIGPITVDLPSESADPRTGFHAGPGSVELVGADAVAYLRSRTWEERRGNRWVEIGNSDLDRIEHAADFAERAIRQMQSSGGAATLRVLRAALDHGHVDAIDPLAVLGLAWDATTPSHVTFDLFPTIAERTADQQRSPFAPLERGAVARLLPEGASSVHLERCPEGQGPT